MLNAVQVQLEESTDYPVKFTVLHLNLTEAVGLFPPLSCNSTDRLSSSLTSPRYFWIIP